VSQESSADVVREALGLGARGNVVKTNAGSELLEGVNALLQGDQFVSRRFSGHDFVGASDLHVSASNTRPFSSNVMAWKFALFPW
jgi:DNA-binding NarL/FixJ family response regulator